MIKCKSIYDKPLPDDGERIFIDRLWPEGISTMQASISHWLQELAPSYELWRHGFDIEDWDNYKKNYFDELSSRTNHNHFEELNSKVANTIITFLYGTSHPEKNNATAIKEYLQKEWKR